MSRVRIPPTLRTETRGARDVEASGGTVRELLDDLLGRFPTLRGQLLENDELAPFVNVYVEQLTDGAAARLDLARAPRLGAERRRNAHATQCPTPAQNCT